jgi:hypothetical protein
MLWSRRRPLITWIERDDGSGRGHPNQLLRISRSPAGSCADADRLARSRSWMEPEWESNPRPTHYEGDQARPCGVGLCRFSRCFRDLRPPRGLTWRRFLRDFLGEILGGSHPSWGGGHAAPRRVVGGPSPWVHDRVLAVRGGRATASLLRRGSRRERRAIRDRRVRRSPCAAHRG